MTKYTAADLQKEARRAVKHAECYVCGSWTGRVTGNTFQRWEIHLGNGSGHPALVAFYVCKNGHETQTTIAI